MVGVEEGREFRFRGDLYSQESTFPLVVHAAFVRIKLMMMIWLESSVYDYIRANYWSFRTHRNY